MKTSGRIGKESSARQSLPDRSDRDLELQNLGLVEVSEILEAIGVRYFLVEGALLGAVRGGDFIKWDWDVGIALMGHDSAARPAILRESFEQSGFTVETTSGPYPKLNVRKYGSKYELCFWTKRGRMLVRSGRKVPSKFFETIGSIELRNRLYPCPHPPEDFLTFYYGNWKIPVRSMHSASSHSKRLRTRIRYWLSRFGL